MSSIAYLRSFRIADIALFDLIGSIIGLYSLLYLIFPSKPVSFYMAWTIVLVLPISVIVHFLTNTPTMLNFYLGISSKPLKI